MTVESFNGFRLGVTVINPHPTITVAPNDRNQRGESKTMKNIKIEPKMSATMARVYSAWRLLVLNDPNRSELWNVYGDFSADKERAMNHCKSLKSELDGEHGIIIGHNSFAFSYGFQFVSPETGALCFAYITKDYDRFCEVDPSKVTTL